MKYEQMVEGIFMERPNRFIAHVLIDNQLQVCHVKNTGRCRELLLVGTRVWCQKSASPKRKTQYDLIAVQKGDRIINMDSQVPNAAAKEWLASGGLGNLEDLRAETKWGESRFDFSFQKDGKQCFLEVKGVTLEENGICAFPDAPTVRGTRHVNELAELAEKGYGAYILFVIQMADVEYLRPNEQTDPAFALALRRAMDAGVQILAMDCVVTPDTMVLRKEVPVRL